MDTKYFEEIKAREQAATPGPWKHEYTTDGAYVHDGDAVICRCTQLGDDAAFIAHARTDTPALIAALREAQDENTKLISEVQNSHNEIALELACEDETNLCPYGIHGVRRLCAKEPMQGLKCKTCAPQYYIKQAQEQEGNHDIQKGR